MTIKQKRKKALGLIKRRYRRAIAALAERDEEIFKKLIGQHCELCDIISKCENCPAYSCYYTAKLSGKCRRGELKGDDLLVAMLSLYGNLWEME